MIFRACNDSDSLPFLVTREMGLLKKSCLVAMLDLRESAMQGGGF